MGLVTIILGFVLVLGTMVVIHEFGHFIVAKLLKIKVEVFSVGFGPRLFGYKYGDTDYRLSAIPLGGFVKMKGENLDEQLTGDRDEFMSHPKWHRFLVAVAGPSFNIVTALLIPTIAVMIGIQVSRVSVEPAGVGAVVPDSPAVAAGLQPGDRIVEFAGIKDPKQRDVDTYTMINAGEPIALVVERDGQRLPLTLTPKVIEVGREKLGDSGIRPMMPYPTTIRYLEPGSPADKASLQPGDKLVAINGEPQPDFYHVSRVIKMNPEQELTFTVERAGQRFEQKITPEKTKEGTGRLGFVPAEERVTMAKRNPIEAIKFALEENRRILSLTATAFGQIFAGRRDVGSTVAGPIRIAEFSGQALQAEGWYPVFNLMALLSLNLGIFNLLPIPVLDGGLIFMLGMEAVLGWFGRPLTLSIKEKMMQVGFVILLLLMGFVIFNDVMHVIPGSK